MKFRPPGAPADIFNVVIYDKAAGVYRRWVMLPDGVIQRSIGVAISKTRAISWSSTEESADGIRVVGIETYDNESSSWREISMDGDKVVSINEGTATKVK